MRAKRFIYILQGKELQMRKKKEINKFPTAFRKMARERLKTSY